MAGGGRVEDGPRAGLVSVQAVRAALAHLYDLSLLQTSPMAALVDDSARSGGAGRRLHRALLDALDALRPSRDADARALRRYRLLELRYREAMPVAAVQAALALGKSQYHSDHGAALEALTSLLRERLARPAVLRAHDTGAEPLAEGTTGRFSATRRSGPPRPLNSFVGRERERAEVAALLGRARLVTITGPPGAGKTRLALEVATDLAANFAGGVQFVPLAPVADAAGVVPAIAWAVGLRESGRGTLFETVKEALRGQALLLLLDNFEQVVDAGPAIAEIAAACPRLAVLVTSRAVLRVAGEREYVLGPLGVPGTGMVGADVTALVGYSAVRLFVARAETARRDFALTRANATAVEQICRRLDGLPLAIELAAARLRLLTPAQIAARLNQRFQLLAGGHRGAEARHQTLRAAVDWSYDLLSKPERRLLRRLAVFVGGFDLGAAEAVFGDADADPLETLAGLVEKSLVVVDEWHGEARYHMLETIREYGLEQLAEAGELVEARNRHLAWCATVAERCAPEMWGPKVGRWLARWELEHDNLAEALSWCAETDPEAGLRLTANVWRIWHVRGRHVEGGRWIDRMLVRVGPVTDATMLPRANALLGAANLSYDLYDPGRQPWKSARRYLEQALALFTRLDDRWGVAECLRLSAMFEYDVRTRQSTLHEVVRLSREAGNSWCAAMAIRFLGIVAHQHGDRVHARELIEESSTLFREVGEVRGLATNTFMLGDLALWSGDVASARRHLEQALPMLREIDDLIGLGRALTSLAIVTRLEGDLASARGLYAEGADLGRRAGSRGTVALGWRRARVWYRRQPLPEPP